MVSAVVFGDGRELLAVVVGVVEIGAVGPRDARDLADPSHRSIVVTAWLAPGLTVTVVSRLRVS